MNSFHKHIALFLVLLTSLLYSCDVKENNKETDPKSAFIKIYENNAYSESYLPLDIAQTSDGGYIHLAKKRISESSFYGTYVMKTDALGSFVNETNVDVTVVNPLKNIMKVGNEYYFIAMNSLSLATIIMKISEDGIVSESASLNTIQYPLAASLDASGTSFILQHYNRDDKKTVVSQISFTGTTLNTQEFNIGFGDFDVEEPIIDHLTGNGKNLPFLCGDLGNGTFFFNGFYNYTLSTIFFTFGNNSLGLLQGYKDERCVSGIQLLSNGSFSIARYAYGENFFTASTALSTTPGSISGISTIEGKQLLELNQDAQVVLKKLTLVGKNLIVLNSDTKSGQLIINFYDENSGTLMGTKYIGYSTPFKVGNLIATADGGLALVGTTYLAGRFPRIAFVKLSKEDVAELFN